MKKQQADRWPKHLTGKQCGYHLYEDGSMVIADSHADKMKCAQSEEEGLSLFVAAINEHLAKQYTRVARMREAFWSDVKDDYGLDFENFVYSFNQYEKKITKKPKPKDEKDKA